MVGNDIVVIHQMSLLVLIIFARVQQSDPWSYLNCDTNDHIIFIFDTSTDDLDWKNQIDFWRKSENQNGRWRPFCENMIKMLVITFKGLCLINEESYDHIIHATCIINHIWSFSLLHEN